MATKAKLDAIIGKLNENGTREAALKREFQRSYGQILQARPQNSPPSPPPFGGAPPTAAARR